MSEDGYGIVKRTIYNTPDGQTFNTWQEARSYLVRERVSKDLTEWLRDHFNEDEGWAIQEVFETILNNRRELISILQGQGRRLAAEEKTEEPPK